MKDVDHKDEGFERRIYEFDVDGSLSCELNGKTFDVHMSERTIVLQFPDMATGLNLLRFGSPRGSRLVWMRRLEHLLIATGRTLEFRLSDKTLGRIGPGEGTRLWRLLGLPAMYVRPWAFVSALGRSR